MRVGKAVRQEWMVDKLIDGINSGKFKLEFLYQYMDGNTRIAERELRSKKKAYFRECMLKISACEVNYYWNNLCEDCSW